MDVKSKRSRLKQKQTFDLCTKLGLFGDATLLGLFGDKLGLFGDVSWNFRYEKSKIFFF